MVCLSLAPFAIDNLTAIGNRRENMLFNKFIRLAALCSFLFSATGLLAWGEEGHKIVAEIAKRHLDKETLAAVMDALDGDNFDDASIWMDEVRKESRYFHMVTWHYINLEKGEEYVKNKEENSVNELRRAVKKLNNRKKYNKKDTAKHLKIIFHLVGDLHQPLHNGYGSDRGGNNVSVEYKGNETNLHGLWDYEIISARKITVHDCLKLKAALSSEEIKAVEKLNVVEWFKQSRAFVDQAYEIGDGKITEAYVDKNAEVIKRQMLYGGMRLAAILKRLYKKGAEKTKDDSD